MVVLLLELELDVGIVTGGPLLVAPCLRDPFTWNDFRELSADVSAEQNEPKAKRFASVSVHWA